MKKVLILLSAYNGEKYLAEQLDSLYSQQDVEINILARDDGSQDNTIQILGQYALRHGNIEILQGRNTGAAASFRLLIKEAVENYPDFDYYSFCDQDDVWLPSKLITAVTELEKSDSKYKFFECDYKLVDSRLIPIANRSHVEKNNDLASVLMSNHSLGCTQTLNYNLLELIDKFYNNMPSDMKCTLHDAVANRMAWAVNSHIVQSGMQLLLYRQHEANEVGAPSDKLQVFKNRIKRLSKNKHDKKKIAGILLKSLPADTNNETLRFIDLFAHYDENLFNRFKLILSKNMRRKSATDNLMFSLMVLFGYV